MKGGTPVPFPPLPPGHICGTLELWGTGLETLGLVQCHLEGPGERGTRSGPLESPQSLG